MLEVEPTGQRGRTVRLQEVAETTFDLENAPS